MAYKEITSVDECLPIDTFRYTPPSDIPNHYNAEMVFTAPLYLFGKVHRYTSITSADIEMPDTVDRQTPLAFCFAFPAPVPMPAVRKSVPTPKAIPILIPKVASTTYPLPLSASTGCSTISGKNTTPCSAMPGMS